MCDRHPSIDQMGIWSEDGSPFWLPVCMYPTRMSARMFAMKECDGAFLDFRVLKRYMVLDNSDRPIQFGNFYRECPKDHPGAFAVWRVE